MAPKRIISSAIFCAITATVGAEMSVTSVNKNAEEGIEITVTETNVNNCAVLGATLMMDGTPVRNASGVGVSVADSVATVTLMFPAVPDSLYNTLRVKTASGPIDLPLR